MILLYENLFILLIIIIILIILIFRNGKNRFIPNNSLVKTGGYKKKTICLTIGPYRNATTLLASIMSLHPNVQVLNHGGVNIYKNHLTNFIKNKHVLNNFYKHAINKSKQIVRGQKGGSILASHAYDDNDIKLLYKKRYGDKLVKNNIQCLFWKESQRTLNELMRIDTEKIRKLLLGNSRFNIKIIAPIRNPLDIAQSTMGKWKKAHTLVMGLPYTATEEEVLEKVIDSFKNIAVLKQLFPQSIMIVEAKQFIDIQTLDRIQKFTGINNNKKWIKDVIQNFEYSPTNRIHSEKIKKLCISLVNKKLQKFTKMKDILLKLIN